MIKDLKCVVVYCLIAALFLFLNIVPVSASDEFDALREKYANFMTGGTGINTSDPDIAAKISALTASAAYYWSIMDKSASRTYLWSDLASTTASSHITNNYSRVAALAVVYNTVGSSHYHNDSLKNDIIGALDWLYTYRYNENKSEYDNWWDWEIGTPIQLNNAVILMYDHLGADRIANYMKAIDKFSPDPTKIIQPNPIESTAANRVSMCMVTALRSIILKDSAKLGIARDALGAVFDYVTSGDGFYVDGSFIQHGKHPYNGGYGLSLLSSITDLMYLLSGSSWSINDQDSQKVYKWVYDSFEPLIYKGIMMDMVSGRASSRWYNIQYCYDTIVQTLLRLSQIAPEQDAYNYKGMVKYYASTNTVYNLYRDESVHTIGLLKQVMSDNSVSMRSPQAMNKQFPSMDRVVHLRPAYAFGLSMNSHRIFNYESILGENLRGWYTSDGMTFLYNNDLKQYVDGFWPTVNPYRLPGTTVEVRERADAEGSNYLNPMNQTGGACLDGMYGVSGMYLRGYGGSLEAKKAWFMFDNEIVALGAGIKSTDGVGVETVMDNRMLNANGDNILTVDGVAKPSTIGWTESMAGVRWLHLAGNATGADVGYYLPGDASINALREARSGSWRDINLSGTTNAITRNYMNLWFDHGTNPSNATYAYVLLPGKTAAETAAYADNPDVEVLSNDSQVQAVRQKNLNITGMIFWQDATRTFNGITCDKKAAVIMKETGEELDLAVSDPTQLNSGVITLDIGKIGTKVISADPEVTVKRLSPTIQLSVNVKGSLGKSFSVRLNVTEAKAVTCIYMDDQMSISPQTNDVSQIGTANFRAWTTSGGTTLTGVQSNGAGYEQLEWKQSLTSIYKDNIYLSSPSDYSTSSLTIIELKYKLRLDSYALPAKPSAQLKLYIPNIINFDLGMDSVVPTEAEQDTWKTVKFIIDPFQRKVFSSYNGGALRSVDFLSAPGDTINNIRIYTRAIPSSGLYTDGVTPIETPITWTFDSINVYQAMPDDLFTIDTAVLTRDSAAQNRIHFGVTVRNQDVKPRSGVLITAFYAKNNDAPKLMKSKSFPFDSLEYGNAVQCNGTFDIADSNFYVKIFLWGDLAKMEPYDTKTIDATEIN